MMQCMISGAECGCTSRRKCGPIGGGGISREQAALKDIAASMRTLAEHTAKQTEILERWDRDGAPRADHLGYLEPNA